MAQAKKSRAFIIGDKDNGLTIVVTDPVMVVHYSVDDLKNAAVNQMNAQDPIVSMAAVVQDVLPLLRGVDVVQMRTAASDMANSAHGSYSLTQEANLLGEIDYARTIGQIIRRNGTVCDVDFCVALDVDPSEIAMRGRNTGPASQIADYLAQYGGGSSTTVPASPQKFGITTLETDNLGDLPPWKQS